MLYIFIISYLVCHYDIFDHLFSPPLTQFFLKCELSGRTSDQGNSSVAAEYCKLMRRLWDIERFAIVILILLPSIWAAPPPTFSLSAMIISDHQATVRMLCLLLILFQTSMIYNCIFVFCRQIGESAPPTIIFRLAPDCIYICSIISIRWILNR